jgi:hypothetical protein
MRSKPVWINIMKPFYVLLLVFLVSACIGKMKIVNELPELLVQPVEREQVQNRDFTIEVWFSVGADEPFSPEKIRAEVIMADSEDARIIHPLVYVEGDARKSRWQARIKPERTGRFTYFVEARAGGQLQTSETFTVLVISEAK